MVPPLQFLVVIAVTVGNAIAIWDTWGRSSKSERVWAKYYITITQGFQILLVAAVLFAAFRADHLKAILTDTPEPM